MVLKRGLVSTLLLQSTCINPTSKMPSKKICAQCKHFIPNTRECRKFENVDLVTGKKTYETARHTRQYENKCGEKGNHFERNNYRVITVPYYFVKNNWGFIIVIGVSAFYTYLRIKMYQ